MGKSRELRKKTQMKLALIANIKITDRGQKLLEIPVFHSIISKITAIRIGFENKINALKRRKING